MRKCNRIMLKPKQGESFCVTDHIPGCSVIRVRKDGTQVIELPAGRRPIQCCRILRECRELEFVEADHLIKAKAMPNDPLFLDGSQWGLVNVGQSGGTPGADISASSAWDIRNSAAGVVVAVIDTGARLTHEDLAGNLWTNPAPDPELNDLHGFNAIAESGNVADDNGHGTHVAGTIGAVGNNGLGVTGVAWQVQLMILKALDDEGSGLISDAVACVDYAREHGARIINASFGSPTFSQTFLNALNDARAVGILVVAAAGNEAENNDTTPAYPASYGLDNIISVAATTRNDTLANFSNFGKVSVHIGAPGHEIVSTEMENDSEYGPRSGTSMAAPHVAGAAAILYAHFPTEGHREIRNRILNNVDVKVALQNKCVTSGRLNLLKALTAATSPRSVFTDYVWPENIPLPFIDYNGQLRNATLVGQVAGVVIARRSRFKTAYGVIRVRWVFDALAYDRFKTFYGLLGNGTSPFSIPLRYPKESELTDWMVRMIAGYAARFHDGHWIISAQLDLMMPTALEDIALLGGWVPVHLEPEESGEEENLLTDADGFPYYVKQ